MKIRVLSIDHPGLTIYIVLLNYTASALTTQKQKGSHDPLDYA